MDEITNSNNTNNESGQRRSRDYYNNNNSSNNNTNHQQQPPPSTSSNHHQHHHHQHPLLLYRGLPNEVLVAGEKYCIHDLEPTAALQDLRITPLKSLSPCAHYPHNCGKGKRCLFAHLKYRRIRAAAKEEDSNSSSLLLPSHHYLFP